MAFAGQLNVLDAVSDAISKSLWLRQQLVTIPQRWPGATRNGDDGSRCAGTRPTRFQTGLFDSKSWL